MGVESFNPLPTCQFNGLDAPALDEEEEGGLRTPFFCPHFRGSLTDKGFCATFNMGTYSKTYKVGMDDPTGLLNSQA